MKKKLITGVEKGSIAHEFGVEPGDALMFINEMEIKDVFDYRYAINEEYLELGIQKKNGEEWILEIEKELTEDLGLVFDPGLMDKPKSCRNKCVFCFIDQLPKKMRETLYFKDDDFRLSFLEGNYVTLTNLKDEDIDRIIFYHLSPINISIHTTDPNLRKLMLRNVFADKVMKYIRRFVEAGISMNFQIVLCKGINDGEHLDKTIYDLIQFIPNAKSLCVVPVGLTKHRDDNRLYELEVFEKDDCIRVLEQIHKWQSDIKDSHGTNFVFAADEFYLKAEMPLPSYEEYEDFPQIENGVGMIKMFEKEFFDAMETFDFDDMDLIKLPCEVSLITGRAAFGFIKNLAEELTKRVKGLVINVYEIYNDFFGENITVSGLITGGDVINQLKGKNLGEILFIPINALRFGEEVFLDDICVKDIQKALNIKVVPVRIDGGDFMNKLLLHTSEETK